MISSLITSVAATDIAAASAALYLLPALIARARHLPALTAVVALDVLAGWTLIGWVIALAIALAPARHHAGPGKPRTSGRRPSPAQPPHSAGWAGPPGPPPARAAPAPPLILPGRPGARLLPSQADRP